MRAGCWFSPWSKLEAVDRVLKEIENRPDKGPLRVMLDLELPVTVNPGLLIGGLTNFEKAKRRIERFVRNRKKYGLNLVCTEAPTIQMPEFMQSFGKVFWLARPTGFLQPPAGSRSPATSSPSDF